MMKAFVITIYGNKYSERKANKCMVSGAKHGIEVLRWHAINKEIAEDTMKEEGLKWTWAKNNTAETICPKTGLKQFPYTAADIRAKIGCSMSHYLLWKHCVRIDESILILEHDAVFIADFPHDIEFNGICQINDPFGATPKGQWWSQQMKQRGGNGVFPKTEINLRKGNIPDGLAGNSAYLIKPTAASELINKVKEIGLWVNDALICRQLFFLEEYYPFITKVNQQISTSTT